MNKQQRLGLWMMLASIQVPLFLMAKTVAENVGAIVSMALMFFGGTMFLLEEKLVRGKND